MKFVIRTCGKADLDLVMERAKAAEQSGCDVEIVVDVQEDKPFYTTVDIMRRFHVGEARAYDIVHDIKDKFGNSLGSGKVLRAELEAWEKGGRPA